MQILKAVTFLTHSLQNIEISYLESNTAKGKENKSPISEE